MKYRILGWMGIVWGALVVLIGVRGLLSGGIEGSAYGAGRLAGLVFGGLLVFAGIRALRKKPGHHDH